MKKALLALLITSLYLGTTRLLAQDDLLAVNTNFGPSRPATTPPESTATIAPASPVVPPSVTPATPPVVKPVVTSVVTPVAPSAVAQTVNEESVRRQEAQIVAQQYIREGVKLYYDGKYNEAIPKLDQALKLLPSAPATEIDKNRASRCLSESYYRLADAAYRAGDNTKARDFAKKSLAYLPDNRASENIIVKIKISEEQTAGAASSEARNDNRKPSHSTTPKIAKLHETPEFKAKQDEINKLFREGRILTSSGQFDEAEQRYKQILLIDHYNEDAYKNLQDLNDSRQELAEEGVDASRRRHLWEITETWLPKFTSEIKRPQETEKTADVNINSVSKQRIEDKLKKIVFPDVSFREATVSDVIKFLSDESRKYDPDKEGVNIVLGGGLTASAPAPAPVPAVPSTPDMPALAPAPPAPTSSGGIRPITLSLRNVPMIEVLKYVTSLGALKMRIDANAVIVLPLDALEVGELQTRTYNVSPDAIRSLLSGASGAAPIAPPSTTPGGAMTATLTSGAPAGSSELKTFFTDAGVPFPPGSSLTYYERARTIYVRNTVENMEIFERVLSTFNVVPSQVEIEAKFVEISQVDLDELGFQWQVGPFNLRNSQNNGKGQITGGGIGSGGATTNTFLSQGLRGVANLKANAITALLGGSLVQPDALGSISGVIDGTTMSVLVNALNQKQSSDILSAPKVTTISGAQAQVRVVQEFIYPTEYSIPQPGSGGGVGVGGVGGGGGMGTPSIPSGWKTREVGVILNVTPTVNADGYTINLTLVPEVAAFLGMLDYSPPPQIDSFGNAAVSYKIVQPLFETRNLTTSVVIWDGQTVVLGGLIRDEITKIDDKIPFFGDIPFLGRLFRSKVNSRSKRNLLIFVTARLVDPAGNPIHKQEAAPLMPAVK